MIRLTHTLGLLIENGIPSIRTSLQHSKSAVAFPIPDMLPRDCKAISDSYSISLCRQPLWTRSHLLSNSQGFSRGRSTSWLFNFFPPSDSQQFISLQRRCLSSTPSEPTVDSKMTGLSRLINDPVKRKRLLLGMKLGGIALFLLLGKVISDEMRIERSLGPRPNDAEKIVEIKEFVVKFNREKQKGVNGTEFQLCQDQAFAYMDELRYIGGLAARRPFNTDLFLAKGGFLELSTCEDPKVQRESLRYLNMLLKKPLDPTQPAAELLWLEEDLGNMLRNMGEVKDSIPAMQELVTAYGLVLEKIFLFCLDAGSQISNDQKLRVRKRANEVSQKLANNFAFAYQAKNAEVIAKYLPTPSQPVAETIKAMFGLVSPISQASEAVSEAINGMNQLIEISKNHGIDITHLLAQELFSREGWGKLKNFIEKSPKLYEECEDALRRFENCRINLEKDIPFHESIFLLRPCNMMVGSNQEIIEAISELVKIVHQKSDSNWIVSYRLVEMLGDIVLSNRSYEVRKAAFDNIVSFIDPNAPRQVLYKVAITLLSLKNDPLFARSVEKALAEEQELFNSTVELRRNLEWFQKLERRMKKIDQAILKRYSFQPERKSKVFEQLHCWSFEEKAVIPRKDILEKLVRVFQEYRSDTNQQVICGQGGVGKTTLATSYVKEFGRDYTFVHWIDSNTFEDDLDSLLDKLKEKSGINPHLNPHEKYEQLKEYLEKEENQGWLLVIDQVENKDLDKCRHWIPQKGGHVLMTARHLDEYKWKGVQQQPLKCFSPLEAVYYLLQNKSQISSNDRAHAVDIVTTLGCHPLALAQTRAYLTRNKKGISLERFLELYKEERIRIFGSSGASIGEAENESVHTTWSMNFKQLEEQCPKTAELFSFLSFLDSEEIPFVLIEKWKEKNAPAWGKQKIIDEIKILLDHVLLDDRKEGVYGIHPVIREVSRDRLDAEKKRKLLQQAISILRELSINLFKSDQNGKIQSFEILRPHCEEVIDAAREIEGSENLMELYYIVTLVAMYHMYVSLDRTLALDYLSCFGRLFLKFLDEICSHEGVVSWTTYEQSRIAIKYHQEFIKSFLLSKFSDDIFEYFVFSENMFNNDNLEKIDSLKNIMSNRIKEFKQAKQTMHGYKLASTLGFFALGSLIVSPVVMGLIGYVSMEFAASLVDNILNEEEMLELIENIISGTKVMCDQSDRKSSNRYDAKLQNRITTDDLANSEREGAVKEISDQNSAFEKINTLYMRANDHWFKVYKNGDEYKHLVCISNYQTARDLLEQALEIYHATSHRSVDLKQITVRVCRELARVCANLGDVSAAIDHQKKSYKISRSLHDSDAHRDVRRSLAVLKEYQKMQQNFLPTFSLTSQT